MLKIRDKIYDLLDTLLGWLLVSLLAAFIALGTLLIFPFAMLHSMFKRADPIQQEIVDHFYEIYGAMTDGNLDALKAEKARDPDFPVTSDNFIGRSWVINAVDCGNQATLAWVLEHDLDLNHHDDDGRSPLHAAIEEDNAEATRMLIDKGAEVNAKGTLDVTPLHVAASLAGPAVISHLLLCGADPTALDTDYVPETPLDRAHLRNEPEIIALLTANLPVSKPKPDPLQT